MTLSIEQDLFVPALPERLRRLGLAAGQTVEIHENRSVMVSLGARGVVRVHRGYAYAGDDVLRAIVAFAHPDTSRARRAEVKRILLDFPAYRFGGAPKPRRRRQARTRREDLPLVAELEQRHEQLNRRFFEGGLSRIRFRISTRMRTRLGELTMHEDTRRPREITISRQHVHDDGWQEVEQTLLHEMIHQWQAENGMRVDHGATFRAKAVEVGVAPLASRKVSRRVRVRLPRRRDDGA